MAKQASALSRVARGAQAVIGAVVLAVAVVVLAVGCASGGGNSTEPVTTPRPRPTARRLRQV